MSDQVPAAIYARISKDREGAGLGVERQEADCRLLADRLGWDVVAVYVDNDISAYSGAPRPQYRAMLDAIRGGEVRGVIAWHTDRLHRRPVELEEFITLAETHNLAVQTVKAGDLNLSTASGRMVARMLGAAARAEVDNTRDRIKRSREQMAGAGKYRGGQRPFGYEKDGVTVRAGEAAAVLDAARAVLAGRSLRSIAHEWNERGLKTSKGREWNVNRLRDVLMRPRNAGILAHGLPGKPKGSTGTGRTHDYEEVGKAAWPAIVPEEEWRALVALFLDPARRKHAGTQAHWLGSGIYRCGIDGCGAVLRPQGHGGTGSSKGSHGGRARKYHYRCSAANHLTISCEPTDEYVRGRVSELVRDPDVIARLHPSDPRIAADRTERTVLAARLAQFEEDYSAGRIPASLWQKSTAKVAAELAEVDARLSRAVQRSTASPILRSSDPGQAFLDAPIDIQRAVVAALYRIDVLPRVEIKRVWTPERLRLSRIAEA
ncbi:recombinase family protein [Agromyces sp. ZXT2-3]|uniref:recombinase family protein n=1 Tax=Agromyces sp. ZXT2-3 TaxID=3461152 RepID=UPI004054B3DB